MHPLPKTKTEIKSLYFWYENRGESSSNEEFPLQIWIVGVIFKRRTTLTSPIVVSVLNEVQQICFKKIVLSSEIVQTASGQSLAPNEHPWASLIWIELVVEPFTRFGGQVLDQIDLLSQATAR